MKTIEEVIRELPPELRREVEDFVQFLLEKRARKPGRKLRQDWAGALQDLRDQYTSLELQKKALEWRGDGGMYLVDTNVWLERLLDQAGSEEVGQFLTQMPSELLAMTDFTLHSIGIVLTKLNREEALLRFVRDLFAEGNVNLIRLEPADMERLVQVAEQFNLDFDDAYQYTTAEKYDLLIVSFDADFDRTERGRKTPKSVLENRGEVGMVSKYLFHSSPTSIGGSPGKGSIFEAMRWGGG